MAFIIPNDKIKFILNSSERYKTLNFNFGIVIEKIGMTGHTIKEFIPIVSYTKNDLENSLEIEVEPEFKDTLTKDMFDYP